MEDYSSNSSSNLNHSNLSNFIQEIDTSFDIENINNDRDHYLCTQCLKFPYIKFCKDRKHLRLTCSCFNNKKILIKDLFEKNILSVETNNSKNLLSTTNLNDDIENKLKCKKHHIKFKGFSKIIVDNYCKSCILYKNKNDIIINFEEIKIENTKIKQLLNKINNNNKSFEEFNINNTINKNNDICEKLSKEEEDYFNKLINIIINDYKNYPNFSHFLI